MSSFSKALSFVLVSSVFVVTRGQADLYGVQHIVGGTNAEEGKSLYTCGLRSSPDGTNYCGATLVDDTVVVTAAHCLGDEDIYVSLGAHTNSGTAEGQQMKVKQAIPHPQYNRNRKKNDIAILILPEAADPKIPRIPLAKADGSDNAVGTRGTVYGWGTTTEGGDVSPIKKQATLPILSNEACRTAYRTISSDMICAGGQGGIDSCQGDSGGPLVTKQNDGSEVLVGVVSWGAGCARPGQPGVYSRVSANLDFIKKYASTAPAAGAPATATTPVMTTSPPETPATPENPYTAAPETPVAPPTPNTLAPETPVDPATPCPAAPETPVAPATPSTAAPETEAPAVAVNAC